MWNTRTGQLTRRVTADMGTTFGVGFMPDGKGLVSGGGDNSMKYWDCSSWKATSRSQTSDLDGHQGQTRPEREYSGRNVRLFPSFGSSANHCLLSCSLLSAALQSLLTADGSPLALWIDSSSGTLELGRFNIASNMTIWYIRFILVQQATI